MRSCVFICLAGLALLGAAGCGHLDLAREGDPDRVVSGTVSFSQPLPARAELVVRVLDQSSREPAHFSADMPVLETPRTPVVPRVLGEQRQQLATGAGEPVPFRIEFQADDAALRQGLALEARVAVAGRVRFRTASTRVVTLGSLPFPHEVRLEPVE